MSHEQVFLIAGLLILGSRIRGCFRRWFQPLLRGPDWFFNVQVQPGFYSGAGRKMLQRYRMRMFIPFALDIPIAMAILIPGYLQYAAWLLLAQVGVIHINHLFSGDIAERKARQFAVAEAEKPVPAIMLSLKTRRLRDYSDPKLEATIALSTILALAGLVRYYAAAPENHNLRLVF